MNRILVGCLLITSLGLSSCSGLAGSLLSPGVPLVTADPNAPALTFTTEVVSIEATAVAPESLQVPADYKKK